MTTLDEMEMPEKRQIGYDLEPVVGHEIRGRSHEELADAIMLAVQEGGEQAKAVLEAHGVELGDSAGDADEDEPTAAREPRGELVAVQLLCDPVGLDIFRRDVIAYPNPGLAERYPHRWLSLDEAKALVESDKGRWNFRASPKTAADVLGGE